MLKRMMVAVIVLGAGAALWTVLAYARDMRVAYARTQGRSQLMKSPYVDIESRQG